VRRRRQRAQARRIKPAPRSYWSKRVAVWNNAKTLVEQHIQRMREMADRATRRSVEYDAVMSFDAGRRAWG
jgi:hypothetical protein